jgi:hypothetical protein
MNYFQFAKVKQTYEVTHLQDRGVTGHYRHYRRITKLFLLVVLINKFNKFLVLSKIGINNIFYMKYLSGGPPSHVHGLDVA